MIIFNYDSWNLLATENNRSGYLSCTNHRFNSSDVNNIVLRDDEKQNMDPYNLVQDDLRLLCSSIKKELQTDLQELYDISSYHFDGTGKFFRPMVIMLLARACNVHIDNGRGNSVSLTEAQKTVAMVAEMIHTASLVHDDVVDTSDVRRGKPTTQKLWGQTKAILTGDYILSVATTALARIGNIEVVKVLSQTLEDLVTGEFMQLGSKEEEDERYNHYMKKTFKKTASLIANSCKAVSLLSQCSDDIVEVSYEYGKHIGIAFQLVDDLLDFISNEVVLGKPASADLKLGLATAPVLYAAHQFPEINPMIMRRFTMAGDVERTLELVSKSDGITHTRYLAEEHCKEAIRQIMQLNPSRERQALIMITDRVINRLK